MRDRFALALLIVLALAGARPVIAAENHAGHEVIAPGAAVPGESLYQLTVPLTGQDGKAVRFDSLRGRPMLVTMFYTSCDGVCPMLAFTMRRVLAALPTEQRARVRALMVSFDPERDSPQALQAFAKLHQLDSAQWLLARADEGDVRELAAVLGIRYRPLPGGVFSHSAVITLLDADGVVRARTENLQTLDPDFMRAVSHTLAP
jgi:protein SCO1/2